MWREKGWPLHLPPQAPPNPAEAWPFTHFLIAGFPHFPVTGTRTAVMEMRTGGEEPRRSTLGS